MKGIAMFIFWCMIAAACLKGCEIIDKAEIHISAMDAEISNMEEMINAVETEISSP